MSVVEILNELPRLSDAERRAVRAKLLELDSENEDTRLCNQAALEGALMLEKLEGTTTHLPDFKARLEKIFSEPISASQAELFDRLISGS